MKPLAPLCALALAAAALAPVVRADDDTWHNVYHSLRRFGHGVKDTFTGDHDHQPDERPAKRHATKTRAKARDDDDDEGKAGTSTKRKSHERGTHAAASPAEEAAEKPSLTATPTPAASSAGADAKPSLTATPTPTVLEPTPTPMATPRVLPSPTPSVEAPQTRARDGDHGPLAKESADNPPPPATHTSTVPAGELRELSAQPARVQEVVRGALALTGRDLAYTYGSADPANGGMDCSGFVYHVLQGAGFRDVPRDSSSQYVWVRKQSEFHAVLSRREDTFELSDLKVGDLLFWSGTYVVNRDVPITHVMIYLGKDRRTGRPLMAGASEGRTYAGERRYGVSVYDFKLPSGEPAKDAPDRTPKFEGYASIPGIRPASRLAEVDAKPPLPGAEEAKPEPTAAREDRPTKHDQTRSKTRKGTKHTPDDGG